MKNRTKWNKLQVEIVNSTKQDTFFKRKLSLNLYKSLHNLKNMKSVEEVKQSINRIRKELNQIEKFICSTPHRNGSIETENMTTEGGVKMLPLPQIKLNIKEPSTVKHYEKSTESGSISNIK